VLAVQFGKMIEPIIPFWGVVGISIVYFIGSVSESFPE
jgi:hypothetical protein